MLQNIFGNIDRRNWRDTIGIIQLAVKKCERTDLPQLLYYIRPILRDLLHKDNNLESDKIDSVYRIYHLIFLRFENERDPVFGLEILEELSSILFRLSSIASKPDLPWSCLSEECCLTVTQVIQEVIVVFPKATPAYSIYSSKNLPLLSHLCSTLLEMAEFASWRAVRKGALQSLKILFCPGGQSDMCSVRACRTSIAHFLPGVCQTFCRIVTGDMKIGSTVKEAAFESWTIYLTTVFAHSSDLPSLRSRKERASETETNTGSVQSAALFSSDWYKSTIPNIKILMDKTVDSLLYVQLNSDIGDVDRVSIAFTRWLASFLSDCLPAIDTDFAVPLRNTIVSALVALAALSSQFPVDLPQSEHVRSSCLAREALLRFVQDEDRQLANISFPKVLSGSQLLRKITIDSVFTQMSTLTNQLPTAIDEAQIQKRLRSIHGCLTLMDSNSLSILVSSRDSLHRMCSGLADFLVFNTTCLELFSETPEAGDNRSGTAMKSIGSVRFPSLFVKSFAQFRDPKTLLLIQALVAQLASQDNTVDLFIDTCRNVMLQSGGLHRNACLLLMASGLAGFLNNESVLWTQREMEGLRILNTYFESDLNLALNELNAHVQSRTALQQDQETSALHSLSAIAARARWSVAADAWGSGPMSGVKDLKQSTITICLLLELVCVVSELYRSSGDGRTTTGESIVVPEDLLRLVLPPCFTLASWSGLIGQTANQCLRLIAENCAYSNLGELITQQADYLISSITLDLHRVVLLTPDDGTASNLSVESLTNLQSACNAMTTLFEHARFEILPLLRPMVRQVLSCLDLTYEHHSALFLPALKRLVLTCRQWHAASQDLPIPGALVTTQLALEEEAVPQLPSTQAEPFQSIASKTLENLHQLLLDTRRMHQLPSLDNVSRTQDHGDRPEINSKRDPVGDEEEPCSRIYPDQLHIVEEVMLRCIHLLATSNPKLRMLSMEVLMEGCMTLADESELLLPLVHKIWSSLMARFRDRHAIVVEKAFQFLIVLSNVAGDFLRVRASSDVVPALLNFLNRGVSVSANASESYRHLTCYRVQRDLLQRLGTFCSDLGLSSEALRPVISLCALYVAENQPQGLQQAARQSLKTLWTLDPALVWIVLLSRVPHIKLSGLFPVPPDSEQRFARIQTINRFEGDCDSGITPDKLKDVLSELTLLS